MTKITRIIKTSPEYLMDLAQQLKSQAMDYAYPGEVVLVDFTDEVTLCYEPSKEFVKPLQRVGVTLAGESSARAE
jgi:hypothetical protein